jgi:hypothetical protein
MIATKNNLSNEDLRSDFDEIVKEYKQADQFSIEATEDQQFDNPYGLEVEFETYWYFRKSARNTDMALLKKLLQEATR